jgi:hypothetical protein
MRPCPKDRTLTDYDLLIQDEIGHVSWAVKA